MTQNAGNRPRRNASTNTGKARTKAGSRRVVEGVKVTAGPLPRCSKRNGCGVQALHPPAWSGRRFVRPYRTCIRPVIGAPRAIAILPCPASLLPLCRGGWRVGSSRERSRRSLRSKARSAAVRSSPSCSQLGTSVSGSIRHLRRCLPINNVDTMALQWPTKGILPLRDLDWTWQSVVASAFVVPLFTILAAWSISYVRSPLRRYPGPYLAGGRSPLYCTPGITALTIHDSAKGGQTSGVSSRRGPESTPSSSRSSTTNMGRWCASDRICSTWTTQNC